MNFEENHVPSLAEIDNTNALITQQYVPKSRSSTQQRFMMTKNVDISELSMTKELTDFDRNFLRYLKISIQQENKQQRSSNVREKIDDMV